MIGGMELKTKINLILCFAVLLLIPVVIISTLLNIGIRRENRNEKIAQTDKLVRLVAESVSEEFDNMIYTGKSISADDSVKGYLSGNTGYENEVSHIVRTLVSSDENLLEIALYDAQGKLLPASTGAEDGIYPEPDVEQLKKLSASGYGFSDVGIGVLSNHSGGVVRCVLSINIDGQTAGYCEEYYDLNLFDTVASTVSGEGEYNVLISDSNGNMVSSPYDKVYELDKYDGFASIKKDLNNALHNWKLVSAEYENDDGDKMYVAGGAISPTKGESDKTWGFYLTISNDAFSKGMENAVSQRKTATFFVYLLSMILWCMFVFRFTKPIDDIYNLFLKYNSGEKSARFSSTMKGEVVQIGNSVNLLLDTIEESELRYSTLVEMGDNIIFEYNVNKDAITFSDSFNSKFSFRAKTLKFEDSFFMNGTVQRKEKAAFEGFVERMLKGETVQEEFRFKTIYGDYAWYIVRSIGVKDSRDNIVKIMGALIDIDRAKRREENLLKKANYDSLTKVFNRMTFEVNLANEYDLSQMRKIKIAVLFIDIDDFKFFNDTYGHALGDEVLAFTASTLRDIVGSNGFVGRYGGDEFVICYGENNSISDAGELAETIIEQLGNGFDGESAPGHFTVKCSIGISYFSEQSLDADSVIHDADEAMYTVKKKGKSDYAYYLKPRR